MVKSIYAAHFAASSRSSFDEAIWKAKAPLKCKLHLWLVSCKRIWTADRLDKRGLPHNKQFAMCSFVPEDCSHLFAGCAVTNIIWNSILQWANLQAFVPTLDQGLVSWWIAAREAYHGKDRKRLDCRGRKECLCFLQQGYSHRSGCESAEGGCRVLARKDLGS